MIPYPYLATRELTDECEEVLRYVDHSTPPSALKMRHIFETPWTVSTDGFRDGDDSLSYLPVFSNGVTTAALRTGSYSTKIDGSSGALIPYRGKWLFCRRFDNPIWKGDFDQVGYDGREDVIRFPQEVLDATTNVAVYKPAGHGHHYYLRPLVNPSEHPYTTRVYPPEPIHPGEPPTEVVLGDNPTGLEKKAYFEWKSSMKKWQAALTQFETEHPSWVTQMEEKKAIEDATMKVYQELKTLPVENRLISIELYGWPFHTPMEKTGIVFHDAQVTQLENLPESDDPAEWLDYFRAYFENRHVEGLVVTLGNTKWKILRKMFYPPTTYDPPI